MAKQENLYSTPERPPPLREYQQKYPIPGVRTPQPLGSFCRYFFLVRLRHRPEKPNCAAKKSKMGVALQKFYFFSANPNHQVFVVVS